MTKRTLTRISIESFNYQGTEKDFSFVQLTKRNPLKDERNSMKESNRISSFLWNANYPQRTIIIESLKGTL